MQFLQRNNDKLALADRDSGQYKEQTQRRVTDLDVYRQCALINYQDLVQGMQQTKTVSK